MIMIMTMVRMIITNGYDNDYDSGYDNDYNNHYDNDYNNCYDNGDNGYDTMSEFCKIINMEGWGSIV